MVTKKYLMIGMILGAAGAAFLLFFVDWEARAVKKHLHSIAREMTWAPADSELTIAARIRRVQEKIAEDCLVEVPSYQITRSVSRNDVPTYMIMAKNYYKNLSVKLHDLEVQPIELPQARAVATAYVRATRADGQQNDEILVIEFSLQKVGKQWQVTGAAETQVLEK
jgi:hypothetical protein